MKRYLIVIIGVVYGAFGGMQIQPVSAQEQNILLTAPMLAKEKKVEDTAGKEGLDTIDEVDEDAVPITTGMTSSEVIAVLGRPMGQVKYAKNVTYFYESGEIEFVEGKIDRIKWNGKLYTYRKMPHLARERAGVLIIRPNDPAARTNADSNLVNDKLEGAVRLSGAGTGSMSSSSGKTASTGPKSRWSKPVLNTTDKIEEIGNDRIQLLKDASLEDLLIKNDP
jgi:hypothetical protein